MYNDSIKCENKIITKDDLQEIFMAMGDKIKYYKKISDNEKMKNQMLEYQYQEYTFKDEGSKISAMVDFYDNTSVKLDNYDGFMGVFYNRLDEIKSIHLTFTLNYKVKTPYPNSSSNMYFEYIRLYINDHKMEIEFDLNSNSDKCNDLYELIKTKIYAAPEKYDDIIKKRNKIQNTVSFGIGLIPGMIITLLLMFVPEARNILLGYYVVYPITALFLSWFLGGVIGGSVLNKYYSPIVPNKKYAGHDSEYKSIYKDDVESFINTSDILIGKKVNNLECRKKIKETYEKYKVFIKKELLALLIISLLIVIVGLVVK